MYTLNKFNGGLPIISLSISKAKANSFFLAFVFFDLLLLPKILFSTPISFVVLLPIIFAFGRFELVSILKFTLLSVILVSSVLYGVATIGMESDENIKRAIQFLLIASLLFVDYRKIDYVNLSICLKKIIIIFYLVAVSFLFVFIMNPPLYQAIVSLLYPEAVSMLKENLLNFRYSFHFTDPNSLGYLTVFSLVLCLLLDFTLKSKAAFFLASVFLVLSSQSRGAMLAMIFVLVVYWVFHLNKRQKIYSWMFLSVSVGLAIGLLFESLMFYWELFQERRAIEESMGTAIGGGRMDKWFYFFNNVNLNPFFGVGYYLEREGDIFRPHSDFIRLNLSYGLIVYFVLLSVFGSFKKKYLMLWVFFLVPFLINTIIDDFRLFGLFFLMFFLIKNAGGVFSGCDSSGPRIGLVKHSPNVKS